MSMEAPQRWLRVDGSTVACKESLLVLNENWDEMVSLLTDCYEDAVLMGSSKAFFKAQLHQLIDSLECDYEERTAPPEVETKSES